MILLFFKLRILRVCSVGVQNTRISLLRCVSTCYKKECSFGLTEDLDAWTCTVVQYKHIYIKIGTNYAKDLIAMRTIAIHYFIIIKINL